MGALHQGHLSLIEKAKVNSDFVICSIFVNPAQFNNPDDLEKYPRTEDEDCEKLDGVSCDAVFIPSSQEIYPFGQETIGFDFGELERVLEGEFRPGHFSGVGLVVSKLFNIIQPDIAFFGQKDLQQLAVIKKLARVLNFPIEIVGVETMRESSGLAMSSRNMLFNEDQKKDAAYLSEILNDMKSEIGQGMVVSVLKEKYRRKLNSKSFINVEYLELVNSLTLQKQLEFDTQNESSICIAAMVHGVRLIDNIAL